MTWFKVDDGLWGHRKWVALHGRPGARALWVTAGSWCAANLTDGWVPPHMLTILGGRKGDADALVDVELWHVDDRGGWTFHEWGQPGRQPSRVDVEAKRADARERMQRARKAKSSREQGANVRANFASGSHNPDPTRPDPTLITNPPDPSGQVPPGHRGSRIPDGFAPDDAMVAWVRANCPDVPKAEHERFLDHWRGVPGAKGVKVDWVATWRNWMRRAQDDIATGRRKPATGRRSTTDERVGTALALAAKYDAEDGTGPGATVHQLQIGETA